MKYEQPIIEIKEINSIDIIRTSLEDEKKGTGPVKDFEDTGW